MKIDVDVRDGFFPVPFNHEHIYYARACTHVRIRLCLSSVCEAHAFTQRCCPSMPPCFRRSSVYVVHEICDALRSISCDPEKVGLYISSLEYRQLVSGFAAGKFSPVRESESLSFQFSEEALKPNR